MSDPLASYSFLPWLRRGMASQITRDESAGIGATAAPRASVGVGITFNADPTLSTSVTLSLNGPGEAIGVDPRVVVRVVPQRDVHGGIGGQLFEHESSIHVAGVEDEVGTPERRDQRPR